MSKNSESANEGTPDIGEIAHENFALWNDTLLTKNAGKVAGLYSEDCTFLPTVSPEFKKGKKGAQGYFTHFLEKNPNGKVVDEEIQPLGDDCYLHSGMYNFEVGPDNARQIVNARFSFVWRKAGGKWQVIHHHSSVKPAAH
jgi:uncharacterized protein (TIGR02246 family)